MPDCSSQSKLRDMHEVVLRNRLEQLRRRQRDEAFNVQRELASAVAKPPTAPTEPTGMVIDEVPEPYERDLSPELIQTLSADDKTLELVLAINERRQLVRLVSCLIALDQAC